MRAARVAGFLLVLGIGNNAVAEPDNYEQVRADGGLTLSRGALEGRKGFGFSTEIKGMLDDHLSIGARLEVAFLFGGVVGEQDSELAFGMVGCLLGKVEYLLGTGPLRPVAGLGLGVYSIGSQTLDTGPGSASARFEEGRYLGIAPQLGVDLGKVRLAMTYNALLGAALEYNETIGTTQRTTEISQNFVSLELSFQFAGGKKRKSSTAQPVYLPSPPPMAYPPPQSYPAPMHPAPVPPAPEPPAPTGGPSTYPPS